eukprot:CAMPEP_0196654032 /NCGR_PEP_ID=MMETSP1086-20130531/3711_1 /TAXON_ID=77921 /ORGANISM="Cyanoptyche  gloeocystis , Strain SAG4.97" /LENGTH=68 /DNA_ID=CAMNT_0041985553 /DNA_START=456 /DNA_END=660 /DNA_ORIENTATION=+
MTGCGHVTGGRSYRQLKRPEDGGGQGGPQHHGGRHHGVASGQMHDVGGGGGVAMSPHRCHGVDERQLT